MYIFKKKKLEKKFKRGQRWIMESVLKKTVSWYSSRKWQTFEKKGGKTQKDGINLSISSFLFFFNFHSLIDLQWNRRKLILLSLSPPFLYLDLTHSFNAIHKRERVIYIYVCVWGEGGVLPILFMSSKYVYVRTLLLLWIRVSLFYTHL